MNKPRHFQQQLTYPTVGSGLVNITHDVARVVAESGAKTGLAVVFLRHTSASLVIQENADPDVQVDLQAFFDRLVPPDDPLYRHTSEGPDDMPAHVKGALTANSLTIPIADARLLLGTWQGIYLWEHRTRGRERKVVVHVDGV